MRVNRLMIIFLALPALVSATAPNSWAQGCDASAARELALQQLEDNAPKLITYLSSSEPMARRYAVYGLQLLGDTQNAPALYPLVEDPDREVRFAAVESIGKLKNLSAVKVLEPLLTSDDVAMQYQGIMALGRIGDSSVSKEITRAMENKQLWLELSPWEAISLFDVIELEFYTDDGIKDLLYKLLDFQSWVNTRRADLADMEPSRREARIWMIAHRAAMLLALKFQDATGEQLLLEGFDKSDYDQQASAMGVARLKLASALPGLNRMLGSRWHNNRIDAIKAMGDIGDSGATDILNPLLQDDDLATRQAAAIALEKIDGRKREVASFEKVAEVPTANIPEFPGEKQPPQFIILGVDDCSSIAGLESMVDICRTLDQMGSKAVFTMWVAPLSGNFETRDIEKQKLLLQILFNYGCEFANHTLHHNPGGRNWHSLGREIQIEEVEGCTKWFQDNIDGYILPFTIKYGGGGMGATVDQEFTDNLVRKQGYLYTGQRGQHPNEQKWPYEKQTFRSQYVLETGSLDGNAPPVHETITNPIVSDYPGRFDYDMPTGSAMWKANFEYRYTLPHRPVMAVDAFHDWAFKDFNSKSAGRYSHRNEGPLLKAFLIDVLVTNKDKFPDTHCVTFRQIMEYSLTNGNVEQTLALGNGQDSR